MKKIIIITSSALVVLVVVAFGVYKALDTFIGSKDTIEASPRPASVAAIGEDAVEQMIGVRTISPGRLQTAEEEWFSAPQPFYEPAGMPQIVASEFEKPPANLAGLLAEIAKMYRGESPFTSSRSQTIEYLSTKEPIASEIKKLGKPLPVLQIDADHPDKAFAIKQNFKEFNTFVDLFLGKPLKKEPRISLSEEQYEVMSAVVKKVVAGEFPDEKLTLAGGLIKRMLQDIEDPLPNSEFAKMNTEEREKLREKWLDLLDRYEAAKLAV